MPFKPGQSGNPGGKAADTPNVPPLLSAMRYVGRTKGAGADKGLQVHCRKLLETDPAGFIKQLNTLETAFLKSKAPTAKASSKEEKVAEESDAAEPLGELLDSLIKDYQNGLPAGHSVGKEERQARS